MLKKIKMTIKVYPKIWKIEINKLHKNIDTANNEHEG